MPLPKPRLTELKKAILSAKAALCRSEGVELHEAWRLQHRKHAAHETNQMRQTILIHPAIRCKKPRRWTRQMSVCPPSPWRIKPFNPLYFSFVQPLSALRNPPPCIGPNNALCVYHKMRNGVGFGHSALVFVLRYAAENAVERRQLLLLQI